MRDDEDDWDDRGPAEEGRWYGCAAATIWAVVGLALLAILVFLARGPLR